MNASKTINKKEFGKRLKSLILQKYKTISDFCVIFDLSEKTVEKWLSGARLPHTDTLYVLARYYFDVPIDYLLCNENDRDYDYFMNNESDNIANSTNDDETNFDEPNFDKPNWINVRVNFSDIVLFFPLFCLFNEESMLLDIIWRIQDCDTPDYVNSKFVKFLSETKETPAVRYVICVLIKRSCPLTREYENTQFETCDEDCYLAYKKARKQFYSWFNYLCVFGSSELEIYENFEKYLISKEKI